MKQLNECLVCGNKNLKVYCDMGQMPLVNNLKGSPEEKDLIFPLLVNECPVCTHKQLSVSVDRELLFKDYFYQTGASQKHMDFFYEFTKQLKGQTVLDIGCNDGSLMFQLSNYDFSVVGVDPSGLPNDYDLPVIKDFFPTKEPIVGKFDNVIAFNVFAHNDDPKTFLIEMSKLLKQEGRIYILTTPARLDNFYHEHISYFTPQSMMILAQRCGVEVVSFKTVSMHGESYLFEIKRLWKTTGEKAVEDWIKENNYRKSIKTRKNPLVAYGASASETVLFNYYKIRPEYVVDDNPLKQGKFMPGTNSPIVSCETLEKDPRDLTIIVAHHLFDEISAKIRKLRPNHKDTFERLI